MLNFFEFFLWDLIETLFLFFYKKTFEYFNIT